MLPFDALFIGLCVIEGGSIIIYGAVFSTRILDSSIFFG